MVNKTMKRYGEKGLKMGRIMEIKVNSTSSSEVLTRVGDLISHNERFYIVTPNPELILMSQTNKKLKKALNGATISIPDGVGLKIADLKLKIIKGREFFLDLVKLADKKKWKVFLLGGKDNEAELTKMKIVNLMKNDSVAGYVNCKLKIEFDPGPKLDNNAHPLTKKDVEIENKVIDKINKFGPQLLFVAFGNPKQEIWVNEHLSSLNVGGVMCVGGTFRYIAGLSKLPPKWIAQIGLEWLWRVFTEPKRIGRIFRAVIIFPIKCLLEKLSR